MDPYIEMLSSIEKVETLQIEGKSYEFEVAWLDKIAIIDKNDFSNSKSTTDLKAELANAYSEIRRLQDLHSFHDVYDSIDEKLLEINEKFDKDLAKINEQIRQLTNKSSKIPELNDLSVKFDAIDANIKLLPLINGKSDQIVQQVSQLADKSGKFPELNDLSVKLDTIDDTIKVLPIISGKSDQICASIKELTGKIEELNAYDEDFSSDEQNVSKPEQSQRSYVHAVLKGISQGAQQVVVQRQLKKEKVTKEQKEKNVILKNMPKNVSSDDIKEEICVKASIQKEDILKVFGLGKQDIKSTLRIITKDKETADKIIKVVSKMRKENPERYQNLSARPDYTPLELEIFRKQWGEAIKRNNELGFFQWTVRDLELAKITTQQKWNKKPLKEDKVTLRHSSKQT
uniref:DUF4332 domain-containing protein n=1 Tax=Acrobeloides nanus TaxID=290746 RepID=A0A914CT14_9BILA